MRPRSTPLLRALATLLAGTLFGFGLSLSGMVRPEVVLAFLHGQDLGLLLVMGGAGGVGQMALQIARARGAAAYSAGSPGARDAIGRGALQDYIAEVRAGWEIGEREGA